MHQKGATVERCWCDRVALWQITQFTELTKQLACQKKGVGARKKDENGNRRIAVRSLTKKEKACFFLLCGYQPKINELIFLVF